MSNLQIGSKVRLRSDNRDDYFMLVVDILSDDLYIVGYQDPRTLKVFEKRFSREELRVLN